MAIRWQIRSLCIGPEDDDGLRLLSKLLEYFAQALAAEQSFELVEAQLNLTLKVCNSSGGR